MAFTRVFTDTASSQVSDGNSNEQTLSDNSEWVIERIRVIDEKGNLGNTSNTTIQIAGNSLTDQEIPLDDLDKDLPDTPVWNAYWPANKELKFSYTNESGSAITLKFVVYVRSGAGVSESTPAGEILSTPLGGA